MPRNTRKVSGDDIADIPMFYSAEENSFIVKDMDVNAVITGEE